MTNFDIAVLQKKLFRYIFMYMCEILLLHRQKFIFIKEECFEQT